MRHEGENHSAFTDLLQTPWTRRGLLATGLMTAPLIRRVEVKAWDDSLREYEKDFHRVTNERRKELLGDGRFVPLYTQGVDEDPADGGLVDLHFDVSEDQFVSLDFHVPPSKTVTAPVVLAEFQELIYQVPILRTPHSGEQHIALPAVTRGENRVKIHLSDASEDLTKQNIAVSASVVEGFSPLYRSVLDTVPLVGMRADNFRNYTRMNATPNERKNALTNDAAFFTEIELLEHNTNPDIYLVEVWRGARSESPRDPKSLYNETGRLYDFDPIVLFTLTKEGKMLEIAYQTDDYVSHHIVPYAAFSLPRNPEDPEVRKKTMFHEIENRGVRGRNTGHGMIAPGFKPVFNGQDKMTPLISSFVPPARRIPNLTSPNSTSFEREIEYGRQVIGVKTNLEKVADEKRNTGLVFTSRRTFLEGLNEGLTSKLSEMGSSS